MKIEGILLDLDNTVYDYKNAHTPALEATLAWLAKTLQQSQSEVEGAYKKARSHINNHLHGLASSHSRLLYFQGVCETFGHWPCETSLAAEDLYWQTFFKNMHLRDGCINFLQSLPPKPVAVVTDLTSRIQFQKITKLGLEPYLQAIITSEEAGREKPHADIFTLAAKKLNLPLEKLCMIGDSFERDIEGVWAFNMPCFWLRDAENNIDSMLEEPGVTTFRHFSELINLVAAGG